MAETETREQMIEWLHGHIHSVTYREALTRMDTGELRKLKRALAADVAEMDKHGRLQTMWKHEGFPI